MALDEDEQRAILEHIARDSRSDTARIAAIKTLRSLDNGDSDEDEDGFAQLYELPAGRNRRAS